MLNQIPRRSTGRLIKPGQRVMWQGQQKDPYEAGGFVPALVADFLADNYRLDGSPATFNDMFDYTGPAEPQRMVDRDGVEKWNAHNLCVRSVDATSLALWTVNNMTAVGAGPVAPTGSESYEWGAQDVGNLARYINSPTATSFAPNTEYTHECLIYDDGSWDYYELLVGFNGLAQFVGVTFDLPNESFSGNRTNGTSTLVSAEIENLGGSWYRIKAVCNSGDSATTSEWYIGAASSAGGWIQGIAAGPTITIAEPRSYRSDLAGMVNNPDRTDTYVPTTATAVFLPRRKGLTGLTWDSAVETLSIAGAKMPFNLAAMSHKISGLVTYADTDSASEVEFGNYSSAFVQNLRLRTSASSTGLVRLSSAGANSDVLGDEYGPGVNVAFSIAGRALDAGDVQSAKDGVAGAAATGGAAFDASGTDYVLGPIFNGSLSEYVCWGTDIGDAGIVEASTP